MTQVAIVYHSGYGHTKAQAEHVAKGVEEGGATAHLVDASELAKADEGPWAHLDEADAIIFGAPTYMGSVSAPFEAFADASSKRWFDGSWNDKLAAGFTNSGSFSGDKVVSLQRMMTLAMQHQMIWVSLGLMPGKPDHPGDDAENLNRLGFYMGAAAQSDNDKGPDVVPRASDLATARHLGRRVADVAGRYRRA